MWTYTYSSDEWTFTHVFIDEAAHDIYVYSRVFLFYLFSSVIMWYTNMVKGVATILDFRECCSVKQSMFFHALSTPEKQRTGLSFVFDNNSQRCVQLLILAEDRW